LFHENHRFFEAFWKNLNWRFLIFPKKANWNCGFFGFSFSHPKFSKNQNQRILKTSDDHPMLDLSLKDMIQ
jgi:hypothetical protein